MVDNLQHATKLWYSIGMVKNKKRETATVNIRVYPSTIDRLREQSFTSGKSIARIISECVG